MAKAKSSKSKKMGRPRIVINFDLIDKLAESFCTCEEIVDALNAAGTKCSYDTVERRVKTAKNKTFAEYVKQKREGVAKPKLRKAQLEAAYKGNPSLLIWLGKQYLRQSDAPQAEGDDSQEHEFEEALTVSAAALWEEELEKTEEEETE